jgi:hypothetical protein
MSGGPCKAHPTHDVRVAVAKTHDGHRWGRYCWRCGWWLIHPTFTVMEAVPQALRAQSGGAGP